jgi:hypothetical protein
MSTSVTVPQTAVTASVSPCPARAKLNGTDATRSASYQEPEVDQSEQQSPVIVTVVVARIPLESRVQMRGYKWID